jgi:hypothetical protein
MTLCERTIAPAGIALLASHALALANDLPPGWTARDSTLVVHDQSGAKCPSEIGAAKRTKIESKGAPDLGICYYAGDFDREGLVRVRQYVRGAGETPLAIQNDRMLMEPPPGTPEIVSAQRVGPGPDKGGAPTQQSVITMKKGGLLVDCVSRKLAGDEGKFDFALACSSLQNE